MDGCTGYRHDEVPDFANDGAQVGFVDQQRVSGEKRSPLAEFLGIVRKCVCQGRRTFAWNGGRTPLEGGPYGGGEVTPSNAKSRDIARRS